MKLVRMGTRRIAMLFAVSLTLAFTTGGALLFAQEAARLAAAKPSKIPSPKRFTRQITPGIELIQEAIEEGHPDGPLTVSVVRVNLKRKGVRVEAALAQDRVWGTDATLGRETVSSLAARHKAEVGINAGFFPFAGNPIGLHIQNGELVTEPASKRTCFILTRKGDIRFAAFDFTGAVETDDGKETFALNGLNRRPAGPDRTGKIRDELLVYSPIFFDKTLRSPGRVEVVLSGVTEPISAGKPVRGKVEALSEGGGTLLEKGTVILSGSGAAAEFLKKVGVPGEKLKFRFNLQTTDGKAYKEADQIEHAVAGAPRIVSGGKVDVRLAEEGLTAPFSTTRHPRTAFGVTKDNKLLLVTVDGRQKGVSRGASLTELAEILLRYGATEAVNMDGGGSSAFIIRNHLINAPSDGTQRPVANMLLVYGPDQDEETPEEPASVETPLPEITLKIGQTKTFGTGSDTTLWGLKPGGIVAGFIRQDGLFTALRPGHSTVLATPTKKSGKAQSYRIVVRAPDPPTPTPPTSVPHPGPE